MKQRLLLFMMTALLSVGAWAENLWSGSDSLNYYGFKLTDAKSMSVGDVLTFTVTKTTTTWAGIKLITVGQASNENGDTWATKGEKELISTSAAVGTVKIVVTSEIAEAATANGLWLDGNDCTVTSVDLEKKQATLNLYSSDEGTKVSYWGSGLSKAMFGGVQTGDTLAITIKSVEDNWGANLTVTTLDSGNDNVELAKAFISPDALPTTVKITFTDEMVTAAKSNALYLNGGSYTYTSVDLVYASSGDDSGDDNNEGNNDVTNDVKIAADITNGSVRADKEKAANGETVTLTVTPDAIYKLGTLTVTDENSASVTVTDNGDGTYSFTMPATAVTVNATFTESDNSETTEPTNELVKNDASTDDADDALTEVYTLGTGNDTKELKVEVEKTKVSENNETSYKTNGTISASATTTDNDGTTITLTPTPAENYKLSKLIIEQTADAGDAHTRTRAGSESLGAGVFITATKQDDGKWTFTMPESSVIISAAFAEKTQKPTLDYNKATRKITITNSEYEAGNSVTATLHYTLHNGAYQTTTDASVSKVITENTAVKAWIVSTETGKSDNAEETFSVTAKPTVAYTDGDTKVSLALTAATTTNTADNKLYYTTDGSNPTTSSTELSDAGDIDITEYMTTVKVLALDADGNYSEIVTQDVAYAYYLTASQEWTTYYSPKTFAVPEGLKAYTVKSVTAPANGKSGTVEVEEQQVIAKNTPMLIQNEGFAKTTKYRVTTTTDQTITEGIASEFKGVASATELDNDGTLLYVLVDGVFLRTTGGTLLANRCYLEFGSSAKARSFSIAVSGYTTAIESVGTATPEGEGQWYDLQGRRVMQPQKGIYIRNGKKVVVR